MCAQISRSSFRHRVVFCVRVCGEPTGQSVRDSACERSASGSEFEIGGATSGEDFPRRASPRAPLAAVAES